MCATRFTIPHFLCFRVLICFPYIFFHSFYFMLQGASYVELKKNITNIIFIMKFIERIGCLYDDLII